MLIDVVSKDGEQALLLILEQTTRTPTARGALYFQFSTLTPCPKEDDILMTIRPILADRKAAIYRFRDGDIVITWNGAQRALLETLRDHLYARFYITETEVAHTYYDLPAHGEELRLLCKGKIADLDQDKKAPAQYFPVEAPPAPLFRPSLEQLRQFQRVAAWRSRRSKIEILIVEDQVFSSKLLRGMLDRSCKPHITMTGEKALDWYLKHAPDIVFLDIELPGMDGHQLAGTVNTFDSQAFIIMVTANNLACDVKRAKGNGARAFVTKPYSKRKIQECIRKFQEERKNIVRETLWSSQ